MNNTDRALPSRGSHIPIFQISLFDVYMKLILILPLTTLIQGKISSINRVCFIVIFFLQVLIAMRKITKKYAAYFILALASYGITLINTENLSFGNDIVYYVNWLIYSGVMILNKEKLINFIKVQKKYIRRIMLIWTAVVAISALFPSSYFNKEANAQYFGSFTGSSFRLCPTALFIEVMALISITFYKEKRDILFMLVPLFCGFMASSRTYFVVIVIASDIGLYFMSGSMKSFFSRLVPITILELLLYFKSPIYEKTLYTLDSSQYSDFWYGATSSRTVIWTKILKAYSKLNIYRKIFGGGFGFSSNAVGHYAHNDFIEILANHGIFGLGLYLFSIYSLFKSFIKREPHSFLIVSGCIFIWLMNAAFNMFYYYTCTALSFPILLAGVSYYFAQRNKDDEKGK